MSEVSERYRRLGEAFGAVIDVVPADRWESPSPCVDWTARDVVRHVVGTQGMFLGFVGRELGPVPSVDENPRAAWAGASAVVLRNLEDPEVATAEYKGMSGPSTFEAGVDQFLCLDLVVHAWDLARAAGLEHRMDPAEIPRVRAVAESFGPALRSPQAFGPEVEAPPDADDQARLLAFLGRQP
ncbi:MAG TPA: TIGR03086 family metal-binding protein [Acidimicrobiia bacterium]|nr:TIGR03086 family metal-binding protein [Acidimicrobiia bacterium]